MAVKRKADAATSVDWSAYERRPFKRSFIPYKVRTSAAEATKRRSVAGIELVKDPAGVEITPAPVQAYEELGVLPPWVKEGLTEQQCFEPTPIQAQALPICIAGQNFVGVSPSGSGQTFAFLLPAIVHIEDQPPLEDLDPGPIALILAPTRELVVQITKEANKLLKHSRRGENHVGGLRAASIHDAGNRKEQMKELGSSGSHLVVGTTTRVHDMASKDQLPLLRVTLFGLMELDKILELGFQTKVREISSWIRPERQMVIFSATWPKEAHTIAGKLCFGSGDAVHIAADGPAGEVGDQDVVEEEIDVEAAGEFPEAW